jgi:predicted SAM-dependent methyltransferase
VKSNLVNVIAGSIGRLGRRTLTPSQFLAVRCVADECIIAIRHRAGRRLLRRQRLLRPQKLNLGSGDVRKAGFLNVDLYPGGDVSLDLRLGLPFESDSCDPIFSEHFFEHIDYPEPITRLLIDCLRVLRPGGELRFSVPDTEWPLGDYPAGDGAPYFAACLVHKWHPSRCQTRIEHINYHFRQDGEHRFAYDFETAEKLLQRVGFVEVSRRTFDPSLDAQHREVGSLFVSARKPAK